MTLVTAIKHDGAVFMAGDHCSMGGNYAKYSLSGPKIVARDGWLIGAAGAGRFCQVAQLLTPWNDFADELKAEGRDPDLAFMVRRVMPALRQIVGFNGLIKHNNAGDNDDVAERIPGELLIAFGGALFAICSDLDVLENASEYEAIGSGAEYALGSLYSTAVIDDPPTANARLLLALKAAAAHNASVAPTFDFFDTKTPAV